MLYNNFFSTVWYTPISERDSLAPTRFLLKPISYKTYIEIYNRQDLPDGMSVDKPSDTLIYESVQSVDNLDIDLSVHNWISQLSISIVNELLTVITSAYLPNNDFHKTLALSLDLAVNPKFSSDDWDCIKCQEKRLHFQRNCYLIPEEEHDDTFTLQVLGEVVRKCPINSRDIHIIDGALTARNMYESSILPEAGGIGTQTVFFVIASQKARSVVEHYKNKQLEEHAAKSKR